MRRLISLAILAVLLILVNGCGSEDGGEASPPVPDEAAAASTASTVEEPVPPAPTAPAEPALTVNAAEMAVADSLPDIPYWEGYTFRGTRKGDDAVCVNRIPPRDDPDATVSHVVVTGPALALGEPLDGPCAKAEENADLAIERGRTFFLAMDDDAILLEEVVAGAQDSRPGSVANLRRIENGIRQRLNAYLLTGAETSVGANLILSAASDAVFAAEARDVAKMAEIRREINEARTTLTAEFIG